MPFDSRLLSTADVHKISLATSIVLYKWILIPYIFYIYIYKLPTYLIIGHESCRHLYSPRRSSRSRTWRDSSQCWGESSGGGWPDWCRTRARSRWAWRVLFISANSCNSGRANSCSAVLRNVLSKITYLPIIYAVSMFEAFLISLFISVKKSAKLFSTRKYALMVGGLDTKIINIKYRSLTLT